MESQSKEMVGGVESNNVGVKQRKVRVGDFILRLLALALTLTSAIVLGVNKQTKVVPVQISPNSPPLYVRNSAKWHYLSAFVYCLVSNCIACSYAAISLLILVTKRNGKKGMLELMIMVVDVMMVALLFSGNGAAAAIGLMGYKGNSKVRWNKVCNVFGRFCKQVTASVALSLVGSIAFVFLVALAALSLHKRAK